MSTLEPTASRLQDYDAEAHAYDALRPRLVEGSIYNDLQLEILKRWLPLGPGVTLLSMPVGTGRLNDGLEETGCRVVGCDISGNMLDVAADKVRAHGLRNVVLLQADGLELPFPDASFDAVVCFNLFHLVSNAHKRLFIAELARVLKPGGRLVVDVKSPFYGGLIALWRCSFRKRHRFSILTKCVFPAQFPGLFAGLRITRRYGVKLPFSEELEQLCGRSLMKRINLRFGRIAVLRYFAYGVLLLAEKDARGGTAHGRGAVGE